MIKNIFIYIKKLYCYIQIKSNNLLQRHTNLVFVIAFVIPDKKVYSIESTRPKFNVDFEVKLWIHDTKYNEIYTFAFKYY